MKHIRIVLKPMEPYFLGSERSSRYGDSSQLSLTDPYYLISEKLPSQTSLFGTLRFLGIRSPSTSFHLSPEDTKYIGNHSFRAESGIFSPGEFGTIRRISPLMLIHLSENTLYVRAPVSHQVKADNQINVYHRLVSAATADGNRWLPQDYDHKAWKQYSWCAVNAASSTPFLEDSDLFETVDQVGVNLLERNSGHPGGFFKKQYVMLNKEYAFCYEAELDDEAFGETHGFTAKGCRLVTMGKGRSGFMASWDTIDEMTIPDISPLLPKLPLLVDGKETETGCIAWCASDLLTSLKVGEIKKECELLLGSSHQHRDFSTVYSSDDSLVKQSGRYKKSPAVLRLLGAGSVLYFRDTEQLAHFSQSLKLDSLFLHGKTVGWNSVYIVSKTGLKEVMEG